MSLTEIQQRTRDIDLRMRALFAAHAGAGPTRGTSAATGAAFTSALQTAQALGGADASADAAPAGGRDVGSEAVALAKKFLGTPYRWGGSAPGGFDCSGLCKYVYGKLGIDLPRVSTQQGQAGTAVKPADARPGDLVFFERGKVDHIGLYAGNGEWVVAPKTGDVVKVQKVDLSKATSIRRVAPAPAAAAVAGPADASLAALPAAGRPYAAAITAAAKEAGISPALLGAVAWSESGFRPQAVSSAGAVGLMQLMPRTAAGLGVDPHDPAQALRGGATYLAQQLKTFGGRVDLAVAAYNAGPSAVRKHGGIPPYQETEAYVKTVLSRYRTLGGTA